MLWFENGVNYYLNYDIFNEYLGFMTTFLTSCIDFPCFAVNVFLFYKTLCGI